MGLTYTFVPGRWRTDSPKALPASFSSPPPCQKERNEAIKMQPALAPLRCASHVSPVVILRLFVSFGTWFPPRSTRVAVWHIAAVRVLNHRLRLLQPPLRRGRSHSLKKSGRDSQMLRLTFLSIIDRGFGVVIDQFVRSSPLPPLSFSLLWSVSGVVAVPEPLSGTERSVHFKFS